LKLKTIKNLEKYMQKVLVSLHTLFNTTRVFDFMGPLLLRLYLAPIFWMAGTKKLSDMDSITEWFGNADWGLGLPFPELLAWLATLTRHSAHL
jgi:putative oxidoreductase